MTRSVKQAKPRKRCPSCGAFNSSDAGMCEMCGYVFTDIPEVARPKPASPSTPKPMQDELDEVTEAPPEIDAAPLPRRPPNLPYWKPKPKPNNRTKQRFGVLIGAIMLILAALVGVGLVISGLSRVRQEGTVVTPPTNLQPLITLQAETSDTPLPSSDDAARLPTPTPVPTPVPSPTPEPTRPPRQTYVVQSGDSCFAIATRFGVQVSDIIVWNNLTDNCLIRPGQELFVSPP